MKTVRIYFSSEFTPQNPCCKADVLRVLIETPEICGSLCLYDTNVHGLFHHFLFPVRPWLFHRASCLVQGNPSVPVHNVQMYAEFYIIASSNVQAAGSY